MERNFGSLGARKANKKFKKGEQQHTTGNTFRALSNSDIFGKGGE